MSTGMPGPSMEHELVAWGKAIVLETTGRRSGRRRRVTIGFVERGEDLLVASASESSHWARNLVADGRCQVESQGRRWACRAIPLEGAERDAAVADLILKYGTPAERLGAGLAFRLVPA